MPEPTRLDALGSAIEALRSIADPVDRLHAHNRLRAEVSEADGRLRDLLRETILDLRSFDPPWTFEQIAELAGITPQRAHQLAQPQPTTRGQTRP